ncbi:hypothetical protein PspLS_11370 [Pyricularia sp. CBS 133598]|nr:hypothetical protein PspLS_11370 [Pyricularia sp. CBS 133598]
MVLRLAPEVLLCSGLDDDENCDDRDLPTILLPSRDRCEAMRCSTFKASISTSLSPLLSSALPQRREASRCFFWRSVVARAPVTFVYETVLLVNDGRLQGAVGIAGKWSLVVGRGAVFRERK